MTQAQIVCKQHYTPPPQRSTVKDSAGAVVLDDAPLDAVCDFCKRNGLYLPE